MYSSYLFGQSDSVVANTVSHGASILTYRTSHSFGSFDSWTSALPFLSIGLILQFGRFSLFALHNNCHLKVFSSFVCFADGRYNLSIAESVVFNLQMNCWNILWLLYKITFSELVNQFKL